MDRSSAGFATGAYCQEHDTTDGDGAEVHVVEDEAIRSPLQPLLQLVLSSAVTAIGGYRHRGHFSQPYENQSSLGDNGVSLLKTT